MRAVVLLGLLTPPAEARELAAESGFSFFLSGTYRARTNDGEGWRCLAGVTLAFDQLVLQKAVTTASVSGFDVPASPRRGLAQSHPDDASLRPRPADAKGNASPSAEPPSSSAASGTALPDAVESEHPLLLTTKLIHGAVVAALRTFEDATTRGRLESLRSRARTSAVLPEISVRGGRSTDQSIRSSPTVAEPDRLILAGGADFFLEARLTWHLDRLVFAREELNVEKLMSQHSERKWRWVREVVTELFAWQKALLEQSDVLALPEARVLAQLRALHAAAEVDALTGGWLSAQIDFSQPVDSSSGKNR